jgi:hypothetical protein
VTQFLRADHRDIARNRRKLLDLAKSQRSTLREQVASHFNLRQENRGGAPFSAWKRRVGGADDVDRTNIALRESPRALKSTEGKICDPIISITPSNRRGQCREQTPGTLLSISEKPTRTSFSASCAKTGPAQKDNTRFTARIAPEHPAAPPERRSKRDMISQRLRIERARAG